MEQKPSLDKDYEQYKQLFNNSSQLRGDVEPTTYRVKARRKANPAKTVIKNAMIGIVVFAIAVKLLAPVIGDAIDKEFAYQDAINKPYIERMQEQQAEQQVLEEIEKANAEERKQFMENYDNGLTQEQVNDIDQLVNEEESTERSK